MLRRRRQLAVLLATVVALRALVPLGYMLETGGERLLGVALTLCPQQNPALDLTRLDAHDAGRHDHHAHGEHAAGDTTTGATEAATGIDTTCQLWSGSAALVTIAAADLDATGYLDAAAPDPVGNVPARRFPRVAGARAPPPTLIA